jgi:hypothetical protein
MTSCLYQVKWNTKLILETHLCSYKLWNNHICPKLQTLKSCSFFYSSSSYKHIFLILNLGITPTAHKRIDFFLFDVGIAWLVHKSRQYLLPWCQYCINHPKANPYFLFDANIAWLAHKSRQHFVVSTQVLQTTTFHNILLD